MPITLHNPEIIGENALVERIQRYIDSIIVTFKRVGEEAVKVSRLTHGYQDQTGNLTSSVGYGIAEDGKLLYMSNFDVVKQGASGAKEGKEFLQKLLAENNKGIVLIIVAGKNYAKFVEAKGYNVLASATLKAEAMVKQALDVLKV